jgi:hypothetical protein
MTDANAPLDKDIVATELPDIEFQSLGRFAIHNPADPTAPHDCWEPAPFRLGCDTSLQRFSQPQQARAHALALIQQARRTLCIFSDDLKPWLYHHSCMQQALTAFLLASPRNQLRILVRDLRRSVQQGHRLLTLVRRLPSQCQLRTLDPDHPGDKLNFLIADTQGLLLSPEPGQQAGDCWYNDPSRTRLRQNLFNQAWATGRLDVNARSLLL